VDRDTGSLTSSIQARDNLVLSILIDAQNLSGVLGGDTSHVIVDCRQNGDRFLGDVHSGENGGSLRDTGETLVEDRGRQVRELEVNVITIRADTTTFADLQSHGARDDITRGQILGSGGITFHETFTLRVQKVSTLTTRSLSDQASSTVDTCGVELDKLQILERKAGTSDHGVTITSASVGRGAGKVGTTVSSCGKDSLVSTEAVKSTILHVQCNDTTALAILHDEIHSKVFNEEVGVVAKRLAIERVKNRVTGTISDGSATVSLTT
jgi:hypothetical protein